MKQVKGNVCHLWWKWKKKKNSLLCLYFVKWSKNCMSIWNKVFHFSNSFFLSLSSLLLCYFVLVFISTWQIFTQNIEHLHWGTVIETRLQCGRVWEWPLADHWAHFLSLVRVLRTRKTTDYELYTQTHSQTNKQTFSKNDLFLLLSFLYYFCTKYAHSARCDRIWINSLYCHHIRYIGNIVPTHTRTCTKERKSKTTESTFRCASCLCKYQQNEQKYDSSLDYKT